MNAARNMASTNLNSMPCVSDNYHLKLSLHLTNCERPVTETVPIKKQKLELH